MNKQERALLQAIAADRQSDSPRLGYADWLEEQGDTRAEFVRSQCESEKLPDSSLRYWQLWRRQEELLAAHQAEWMAEFIALGASNTFSPYVRGVVERLAMTAKVFLSKGKQILDLAPALWTLQIDEYADKLVEIGRAPHLAMVHDLFLGNDDLDPTALRLFLASAFLQNLRELTITFGEIGDEGGMALGEASVLGNLRLLNLEYTEIGAPTVAAIANAPHFANLEVLELTFNEAIGNRGAQAIAQSPYLRRLKKLELSETGMTSAGAEALAQSSVLKNLVELRVSDNALKARGLEALANSPHLGRLEELDISECQIASAVTPLATASWKRLKRLYLADNKLTDRALSALGEADYLKRLEVLDARQNRFTAAGIRALYEHGGGKKIRDLSLESCQLNDSAAEAVSEGPWKLQRLELSENRIGSKGLEALAWNLRGSDLVTLLLPRNRIDDRGVMALAGARPKQFPSLRYLDLSNNELGAPSGQWIGNSETLSGLEWLMLNNNLDLSDEGLLAIVQSPSMANLRRLAVSNCRITDAGLFAIAESPYLRSLEWLELGENAITDKGVVALAESPNLAHVEWLDLNSNKLGPISGTALLKSPNLARIENLYLGDNPKIGSKLISALRKRFGEEAVMD